MTSVVQKHPQPPLWFVAAVVTGELLVCNSCNHIMHMGGGDVCLSVVLAMPPFDISWCPVFLKLTHSIL